MITTRSYNGERAKPDRTDPLPQDPTPQEIKERSEEIQKHGHMKKHFAEWYHQDQNR